MLLSSIIALIFAGLAINTEPLASVLFVLISVRMAASIE